MGLGKRCDGSDFGLQPAVDLGRGLGGRGVDVKRMQGEGEHFQVVAILLCTSSALHLRT